ncbi:MULTISPECIES: DUF1493 family protein [Kordiimonas]|jgi:hypothetical protein|uniref:DUF1493 family protein n=1 Tax=Kordiimonas TaxID=288021 RepID=UPI0025795766|nr:DUF1493 family protein [Kordiimonas sp. UBA4487]
MNRQEVFDDVRSIIVHVSGTSKDQITEESSVADDVGIAGDDGDDLFQALNDRFQVDWAGVELEAMFGPEPSSIFAIMPWRHGEDRYQDCTVADIVNSIIAGRWVGNPVRELSKEERSRLKRQAWLQFAGFWVGILLLAIILERLQG